MNNKQLARKLVEKTSSLTERNWKYTVDISKEWDSFKESDEPISLKELMEKLVHELQILSNKLDDDSKYELDGLVAEFGDIISRCDEEGEEDLIPEFAGVFNNLYDWADINSVWVKTIF